jgi:tetratricopeptide (TPR) repeat protein
MASRLVTSLREAPATVPALVAVGLFVLWATEQGGYPLTHWAPAGLIVLVLVAVALLATGVHRREIPLSVRVALACLAAFTAVSFLSILWAGVPGDAWEGANRTLLYLLVFALFACCRQRGVSAALLLAVWVVAMIVLAAFVALHISTASGRQLATMLPFGRLAYPTGYANANAALWLIAAWPSLLLARSRRLVWAARGLLAGGAVLLAEVALLSQSRGAFYATPLMLVLAFAFLPGRARTFVVLLPAAGAIAAAAPAVLRVGNHLAQNSVVPSHLHHAVAAIFISAAAAGAVVAAGAIVEQHSLVSARGSARLRTAAAVCAVLALVALIAGGWAAAGDPIARLRHGWDTFRSVKGYAANGSGSRLTSGLGSNRYDFYRVALDEFLSHPIGGIGADNFQQQYLRHGRSLETPRYPHSVELRTLTETGLAGSLPAAVGLIAALLGAVRAIRRAADPLARDVAAASLGGFAYWLVHGSFDWFWEFAGLAAPAFALLGLACALAPADAARSRLTPRSLRARARSGAIDGAGRTPDQGGRQLIPGRSLRMKRRDEGSPRWRGVAVAATAALAALAAAASLALPWLSQLEVQSAARVWPRAPRTADSRLRHAASLNPLSDTAYLVAGSIALRYGDLALADRRFSQALSRSPDDAYATLERGAIASSAGRSREALQLLARAAVLQPRDAPTRRALGLAREGHRVSVEELNRSILYQAQQLR